MKPFPKLFIPGPTYVPSHVMDSLNTPQIGHRTPEFSELMAEIIYAFSISKVKKWNLADYYNHMADFHDYINDPAPNLRILADKWLQEHSG